jgi:hypothetical protein
LGKKEDAEWTAIRGFFPRARESVRALSPENASLFDSSATRADGGWLITPFGTEAKSSSTRGCMNPKESFPALFILHRWMILQRGAEMSAEAEEINLADSRS